MRTLSQQVSALAYVSVKVIRCPRGATKVEGAQAQELPYSDTPAPTCDFQVPGVVSTPLGPPQAPPFTTAVDKDAEVREGVGIGEREREGEEEGEREREGVGDGERERDRVGDSDRERERVGEGERDREGVEQPTVVSDAVNWIPL